MLHFKLLGAALLLKMCVVAQEFKIQIQHPSDGYPTPSATAICSSSKQSIFTDEKGIFIIPADCGDSLQIFADGFAPIQLRAPYPALLKLNPLHELNAFEVTGRQESVMYARDAVISEIITSQELGKAACCDLSGCFESNTNIQVNVTNVLTQSKELRLLGLSGAYNQVITNGIPMTYGLPFTYGMSSYPGVLIDQIWVSKGMTSVLQGAESITGQINMILLSPAKADKLFLNAYVNSFGETHGTFYTSYKTKNWSHLTSGFVVLPAQSFDRDDDGFLDLPKINRKMILHSANYRDKDSIGFSAEFTSRLLLEKRVGGQVNFNPSSDLGSDVHYGQTIDFTQPELIARLQWKNANGNTTHLQSGISLHNQNSWYGSTHYLARQEMAWINAWRDMKWGKDHTFRFGGNYRHVKLNEEIAFSTFLPERTFAGNYYREDNIPGLFAENSFNWDSDRWQFLTGIRMDYYAPQGWKATPRAMLKMTPAEQTEIRLSAGTGWRIANVFAENTLLLAGSRDVIFDGDILPEEAFNAGIHFFKRIETGNGSVTLNADVYYTRFNRQFFPDYDSLPGKAVLYTFEGNVTSYNAHVEVNYAGNSGLQIKAGWNYLEVYREQRGGRLDLPFNPKHRINGNISYEFPSEKWQLDMNAHFTGVQRLPSTVAYPQIFQVDGNSKPFTIVNFQVTRRFKRTEWYVGCENIFDFRQLRPMLAWQDPFSPWFDTAFNWGPTRGREFYIGLRFKLAKS